MIRRTGTRARRRSASAVGRTRSSLLWRSPSLPNRSSPSCEARSTSACRVSACTCNGSDVAGHAVDDLFGLDRPKSLSLRTIACGPGCLTSATWPTAKFMRSVSVPPSTHPAVRASLNCGRVHQRLAHYTRRRVEPGQSRLNVAVGADNLMTPAMNLGRTSRGRNCAALKKSLLSSVVITTRMSASESRKRLHQDRDGFGISAPGRSRPAPGPRQPRSCYRGVGSRSGPSPPAGR